LIAKTGVLSGKTQMNGECTPLNEPNVATASVCVSIFHDVGLGDPLPKEPVDPDLVDDHDRYKNESHASHDLQGIETGRRIEYGKTVRRIKTRGYQVREQSDYPGGNNGKDCDGRGGKCTQNVSLCRKHPDADERCDCQERDDKERGVVEIVVEQLRGEFCGTQEDDCDNKESRPELIGKGMRPRGKVSNGLDREIEGAVHQEETDEQNTCHQTVRIQQ